jgi:hypothetical protein
MGAAVAVMSALDFGVVSSGCAGRRRRKNLSSILSFGFDKGAINTGA